ncbi:MAG: transporter [Verrucomicrobia bacterium]|nr:transporter [Verrucomicrobiota bacterium]MBU1908527.1 transporter [Verrucomicrobiota bacterium]
MTTRTLAVLAVCGLLAGSVHAGRPLAIDDADPAEPGQVEFEAGAGYVKEGDVKHWDAPFGLTYGVCPRVEAGLGFGGQFEERTEILDAAGAGDQVSENGIGDLVIGAKWQFIESCPLGARHAVVPSVKFPTADEDKGMGSGETDVDLTWIASRALGGKAGLHLNLGYSWIGGTDEDVLHYGIALDYQVLDVIQTVGEVFAERETSSGADTVAQFNLGLRYCPADSLTLDLAAGSRLGGEGPDFTATAGLTWAFLNLNR